MPPPLYFIESNGKLTKPLMFFLQRAFDFDWSSMESTVWRCTSDESFNTFDKLWCKWTRLNAEISASVRGKTVFYRMKNKTPLEWLYLIAHEQVHRNDISQHELFYLSYVMEAVYKPYQKISWEQRAYAIASLKPLNQTDKLSRLIINKHELLISIFQSDLKDQDKINQIKNLFNW